MHVFVAGASGVIGCRLAVLLRRAGHNVVGTTRSESNALKLMALGVTPVIVDVFDAAALRNAVAAAKPNVVIHQLTDLPDVIDPAKMPAVRAANARLRRDGTRNLVDASKALSVQRIIAQSIAWVYAPGTKPHRETDPLDLLSDSADRVTVEGVVSLEDAVLKAPGIGGVVLRYGRLYGPGTWSEIPNGRAPLHVDAAAQAAFLALARGAPGAYNIAEQDGEVSIDKARLELGFDPAFRMDF